MVKFLFKIAIIVFVLTELYFAYVFISVRFFDENPSQQSNSGSSGDINDFGIKEKNKI